MINRSLVQTREIGEKKRCTLLGTLRLYGSKKLTGHTAEALRQRHRDWYLDLAEETAPRLLGAEQGAWLDVLELEHANLRSALEGARETAETDHALRFGAALWRFWEIRGYLNEGRERLGDLLEMSEENTAAYAKVLSGAGLLAYRQTDLETADGCFKRALELERRLDNRPGIANALNDIGIVAGASGRFAQARAAYEESLELKKAAGDKREIAVALHNIGNMDLHEGNYDEAIGILRQSIGLFEETENLWESGFPLHTLGRAALARGDSDLAARSFRKGYERRKNVGAKRGMSDCLDGLGRVALKRGELEKAWDPLREALNLRLEVGDSRGIAESLESFAFLAARREDPARTVRLLGAAEARRRDAQILLPVFYQEDHDGAIAAAKTVLSKAELEALWHEGETMSREDLIAMIDRGTDTRENGDPPP